MLETRHSPATSSKCDYKEVVGSTAKWQAVFTPHFGDHHAQSRVAELRTHAQQLQDASTTPHTPQPYTRLQELQQVTHQLHATHPAPPAPDANLGVDVDRLLSDMMREKHVAGVFEPPNTKRVKRVKQLTPGTLVAIFSTTQIAFIARFLRLLTCDVQAADMPELERLGDNHPAFTTDFNKATHAHMSWLCSSKGDDCPTWHAHPFVEYDGSAYRTVQKISTIVYANLTLTKARTVSAKDARHIRSLLQNLPVAPDSD